MKVCVMGLWHLGTVTAACLASVGHEVAGFDFDESVISNLQKGQPPLFEPGLEALVKAGLAEKKLCFSSDPAAAFKDAELVWVTYDTPVDEDDRADVDYVLTRVEKILPYLDPAALVLISSQLPAGSTRKLEAASATRIRGLLAPITDKIEWMSVESAEMTKHALNAFLATSVVFINEIAALCESVGADAKEVERGLKSEARIGPKAYLGPGGAFAGGTLARDIAFLIDTGHQYQQPTFLFAAVKASNDAHKLWPRHKLQQQLGNLKGRVIAVWGLTYKACTDTLRRSSSVELCQWLLEQGAAVQAHDPAVQTLPENLAEIQLCLTPESALKNASALVIATEWPDYRQVNPEIIVEEMLSPLVLDANAFIARILPTSSRINYYSVGQARGQK